MRKMSFLALLLPTFAAFGQQPLTPHSGYQSQASLDAKKLTESTQRAPAALLTTGERTGWNQTAVYAEAVDVARRLEKASPMVQVTTFGTTPEGREMIALIVSKDRAFTPRGGSQDRQGDHPHPERHSLGRD